MRRPTLRRPGRRAAVGGGTSLAVAVPLVLAAVTGSGHLAHVLDQRSGGAWVVSAELGLLSLVDGPTEEIAATVTVPGAGHALSVAQSDDGTYLLDGDAGTVARVDPATWQVGAPVALGTPGEPLTVLQNAPGTGGPPHVVHVVDAGARTVTQVDPVTLDVRDETALAAQPGPGQAAVADDGALWVVDAGAGNVTRVAASRAGAPSPVKTVRRTSSATPTAQVLLVQGRPVLADPATGTLAALDGTPRATGCLDTRPTDTVQLLGSRSTREVYAAVAGALLVAAVDRQDCTRTVPVADPATARFGPLAQSGRYVFVPDLSTGTTTVVDTVDSTTAAFPLTEPGHRVTLEAKDGLVFYDDLDGEKAGVLTLRGDVWVQAALEKYDPATGEGTNVVVPDEGSGDDAPGAGDQGSDAPQDEQVAPDDAPGRDGRPGAGPGRTGGQAPPGRNPVPGRPGGPGGPGAPGTPSPGATAGGPQVTALAVAPDPVVLGRPATFTATTTGTDGATWAWTLTDPGGGTVTTSDQAASFAYTPPREAAEGTYQLRLTVTVGTLTATRTLPVTVRAPGVSITSLASTEAQYAQYTPATVVAEVADAPPGTTWTWTAVNSATGAVPFTAPAPGDPLQLDHVGDVGTLTVTLTVEGGGTQDTRSVDVPVVYVCDLMVQTTELVLPEFGSTGDVVVGIPGCHEEQVTLVVPAWLSGGGTFTLSPSGNSSLTVTRTGDPPVDGRNTGAVTVRLEIATPQEEALDVVANVPPAIVPTAEMPGGYTSCVRNGDVTTFYASYRDGDQAGLDVVLTNAGTDWHLDHNTGSPDTLYWREVPTASLSGAGWTIRAIDSSGASSPPTAGTNSWSCW
ncbi:PKD domain-containing protein [Cellulomonas sp. Sa3CUA2]|uniref:PKD domain-containing protein n=1 Tax=Cellulomonas avistercoris TaxID=2762242 RepID=A0ABR8QDT6_9CELL|nr:PKD domain-containing protein [Cellulomonas avistercoris]MBD7918583.1 PKD domain-containing protein [Cellulomonas avistercoris]